jgi:hypothetical protein
VGCKDEDFYVSGVKVSYDQARVVIDGQELRISGTKTNSAGFIHWDDPRLHQPGISVLISGPGGDLSLSYDPSTAHGRRGRGSLSLEDLRDRLGPIGLAQALEVTVSNLGDPALHNYQTTVLAAFLGNASSAQLADVATDTSQLHLFVNKDILADKLSEEPTIFAEVFVYPDNSIAGHALRVAMTERHGGLMKNAALSRFGQLLSAGPYTDGYQGRSEGAYNPDEDFSGLAQRFAMAVPPEVYDNFLLALESSLSTPDPESASDPKLRQELIQRTLIAIKENQVFATTKPNVTPRSPDQPTPRQLDPQATLRAHTLLEQSASASPLPAPQLIDQTFDDLSQNSRRIMMYQEEALNDLTRATLNQEAHDAIRQVQFRFEELSSQVSYSISQLSEQLQYEFNQADRARDQLIKDIHDKLEHPDANPEDYEKWFAQTRKRLQESSQEFSRTQDRFFGKISFVGETVSQTRSAAFHTLEPALPPNTSLEDCFTTFRLYDETLGEVRQGISALYQRANDADRELSLALTELASSTLAAP